MNKPKPLQAGLKIKGFTSPTSKPAHHYYLGTLLVYKRLRSILVDNTESTVESCLSLFLSSTLVCQNYFLGRFTTIEATSFATNEVIFLLFSRLVF